MVIILKICTHHPDEDGHTKMPWDPETVSQHHLLESVFQVTVEPQKHGAPNTASLSRKTGLMVLRATERQSRCTYRHDLGSRLGHMPWRGTLKHLSAPHPTTSQVSEMAI